MFPDAFETRARPQTYVGPDGKRVVRGGVRESVEVRAPEDNQIT